MSIAIIFFILFFGLLALARLDLAVLALIVLLPSYVIRFKLGGLPLTLLEVMILISFTVWFFKYYLINLKTLLDKTKKHLNYPFALEIILCLVISFIAAGIAGFSLSALGIWKAYFFEPLLLYILILNIFRSKQDLLKILGALSLSASGVALFAIFQKFTGAYIDNPFWAELASRRVVSFFGYPNAIGLYLAPIIMLLAGWFFSLSEKNLIKSISYKILIGSVIIISLLAIYFARSEGALFALVASLLIFAGLSGRRERLAVLLVSLIAALGIFWFAPNNNLIIKKLTLSDLSGQIREQQWKETLKMLSQGAYLGGTGLNQYPKAVKPYHQAGIFFNRDNLPNFGGQTYGSSTLRAKYWQPVEIYQYPHNIFLNFWTELGLFGLVLFVWLIIKYLVMNFQLYLKLKTSRDRYLIIGLISAMAAIIIHGLVDVPYFKNDLAALFWILFGISGTLNIYYQNKTKI